MIRPGLACTAALFLVVPCASSGGQEPPPDTSAAARATQTDTLPEGWRDPRRARRLAWFGPGLGHFYAGDIERGLGLTGGAVFVASALVSAWQDWREDPSDDGGCSPGTAYCPPTGLPSAGVAAIGFGVALGALYVVSVMDADNAARRMNARRARMQLGAEVRGARPSFRLGVQVALR